MTEIKVIHQIEDHGSRHHWLIDGMTYREGRELGEVGWEWTPGPEGGVWSTDNPELGRQARASGLPTFTNMLCPVTLRANPDGEVFAYVSKTGRLFSLDGEAQDAALSVVLAWPNVTAGWLEDVADWLENPGLYGPSYVVAQITPRTGEPYTAGGNHVAVVGFCTTYDCGYDLVQCWLTRGLARAHAEAEW